MQQPTRLISTPFAQEGEKTEIQNVTGEFDNSATYRLGFPPLTMQSIRSGGKPPKGTDFNGVLFDITENISFLCKGGRYQYNAGLSTLIGGYPKGSNLLLDDDVTEVVSTVAGNQNNPNTDMTGWTFKPNKTTAANVADASGETQQQVNYNGGSKWHSRVGGYKKNERVVLANGDIVKSTIDGNTNDPNVDMTGWVEDLSDTRIKIKLTAVADAVQKSLYEVVYDQIIDVTWFGAIGNWNKDTQTGANSTVAVQNAIAYLATLGTRRQGGKRGLKFPKGSFRLDSITLSSALGFGLDIIGDGPKTTNLYFDQNSISPAITSEIEFVQFRNMSLIGALDEVWNTTRTPMYKGRLTDGRADIDVSFVNCEIAYWNIASQIHGRGCAYEACSIGLVVSGMDIVIDDYIHGVDTNLMQSKFATMRHYNYRNCRFDNCSRAYTVSGAGEMIDFINNGLFIGNDITNMDLLIEAPNAQFVNWCIGGNTGLGSFATSVLKVKAFHMTGVMGNNFTKSTNYNVAPTSNLNSTEFVFDLTAPCTNLTAYGNTIRGIRGAFYRNTSASPSKSVSIYGNNLPEFGS